MTEDLIQWTRNEVKRQRKSYKTVCETAGFEKDTLDRWKDGLPKSIDIRKVQQVLAVLGYDLVPLPRGRSEEE